MKSLLVAGLAVTALCLGVSPADARQVLGTLKFTDSAPDGTTLADRPIRSVLVSIQVGQITIGTGTTNSSGFFSVWIDDAKLTPGTTFSITWMARNYAGDVYLDLDWFNDRLGWTRYMTVPSGTGAIVLNATIPTSEFSVHFSILDAVTWGRQYADGRRSQSDTIDTVTIEYPDADWSYYNNYWEDITLSGHPAHGYGGTDEHGWEDGVVLHEYGHHLEHEISDTDGSGSLKHTHCTDDGYGFAWSEGWATYFASSVTLQNSNALLPIGTLEPLPVCNPGATPGPPRSEGVTQAILNDLHDGVGNEPFDRVDGNRMVGTTQLRNVLFAVFDKEQDDVVSYQSPGGIPFYQDPGTSILSFHDHLVARDLYPGSHADLDRIYQAHGVPIHAFANLNIWNAGGPSGWVRTGSFASVSMTLKSSGQRYTDEPVAVRLTLRTFPTPTPLGDFTVSSFSGQLVHSRSVWIPLGVAPGTYLVTVTVDPDDRLPETNELDNRFSFGIDVN